MRRRRTSENTLPIPRETLRELSDSGANRAHTQENNMPPTTPPSDRWYLENVHTDTVKRRQQFDLKIERPLLGALVKVEDVSSGKRVTVTFSGATVAYARAEAARFYAMVLDTFGDLATSGDDALQVDGDILLTGATVELEGRDAFLVTCQHFGGDFGSDNAADHMMSAII